MTERSGTNREIKAMLRFDTTNFGHFEDHESFCLAYYSTIRETFRFHSKDPELADDLTQQFMLLKILPHGGVIDKFMEIVENLEPGRSRPSFGGYLSRAIYHFFIDQCRKPSKKKETQFPRTRGDDENELIFDIPDREHAVENLDDDSIHAYVILNRALHKVRNHCMHNDMQAHWAVFEALVLAPFDDSRQPENRESLRLRLFPGHKSNQVIDNHLITVKRNVSRAIRTLLVRDPLSDPSQATSLEAWIWSLKDCDSRIHGALVTATRMPSSDAGLFDFRNSVSVMDLPKIDEDLESELRFALALRLQLPIDEWTEWRNPGELLKFLPTKSPFSPSRKGKANSSLLTLANLMNLKPIDRQELQLVQIGELLRNVKDLARSISRTEGLNSIDQNLFKLVYTLAITIARVEFHASITTLTAEQQLEGIWYYIRQPWINPETKAYLQNAVQARGVWYAG